MFKFWKKKRNESQTAKMADGKTVKFLHVYNDGKHDYYIHEHPAQMDYARYMEVIRQQRLSDFNFTPETLDARIVEVLNSKNVQSAAIELLNELRVRMKLIATEDVALKLVALFVYRDDEPKDRFDEVFLKEKIEYWKRNGNIKAFFLNFAQEVCEKWKGLSHQTFLNYLEKNTVAEIMMKAAKV